MVKVQQHKKLTLARTLILTLTLTLTLTPTPTLPPTLTTLQVQHKKHTTKQYFKQPSRAGEGFGNRSAP